MRWSAFFDREEFASTKLAAARADTFVCARIAQKCGVAHARVAAFFSIDATVLHLSQLTAHTVRGEMSASL